MQLTINQLLQYLYLSPEHHWKQFSLESIEYFDVNLFNLHYDSDPIESEVLCFEARELETLDNIIFNVFRNSTSIILEPILMYDINGLELFGSKSDEFHTQRFSEALKSLLRVSVDFVILKSFVDGTLSQMWDIKPNYK